MSIDTIKVLGSLLGNGALSKGSGGSVLTNVLGAALGGNQRTQGGGGIGDVLGGLLGGATQQQQGGGGMADILGGLLGGGQQQQRQQQGGDLGGLLGGLLGGGQQQQGGGGLGGLLGAAVTQYTQSQNKQAPNTSSQSCEHLPEGANHAEASSQAELMIRAMINAAKSDGSVDKAEQDNIIGKLGDISQEEAAFVRAEFAAPLDVKQFAASVPNGMQQQVYAVSLMAIDLDTNKEAQYLHQLANGLGISQQVSNQIHEKLGAPSLYA